MRLLLIIICFFQLSVVFVYAKDADSKVSDGNVVKISAINGENKPFDSPDLLQYEDVKFVPLETNDSCFLSENLQELLIKDSYIFFLDGKKEGALYSFDRNTGKFLCKIGQHGSGPGEYISLNSFFYDKKRETITIIDIMKNAFYTYGLNGVFKEKKGVPSDLIRNVYHSILLDNETLLFNNWINMDAENTAYLLFKRNNAKILAKKSYHPIIVSHYRYAFSSSPMVQIGDRVNFIMPLCDTIFTCYNGQFIPLYVIEHRGEMAPKEKFVTSPKNYYPSLLDTYGYKGYFTGFDNYCETNDYILLGLQDYRSDMRIGAGCLVSKQKKKGAYFVYTFESDKVINTMQDIPFRYIRTCAGDYFVGCCTPEDLLSLKISPTTKDPVVKRLQDVIDNLQEDDNPVLIFYKLKDCFDEK